MAKEEYSWRNTEVYVAGRLLVNCTKASYKRTTEVEVFTDNDGEPSGWGRGDIKGEGSITVSGQEFAILIDFAIAQGYDLLKMPPIPLLIIEKSDDLPTLKHILSQVVFKEVGWEGASKDKRYEHQLPFSIVGPVQIEKM
ncbi:MAG TPA: hypothetical protein PKK43_04695 [Spirochaetota bacterium]|nr:hypothetical protein [Spirochaetota bacterium]